MMETVTLGMNMQIERELETCFWANHIGNISGERLKYLFAKSANQNEPTNLYEWGRGAKNVLYSLWFSKKKNTP